MLKNQKKIQENTPGVQQNENTTMSLLYQIKETIILKRNLFFMKLINALFICVIEEPIKNLKRMTQKMFL